LQADGSRSGGVAARRRLPEERVRDAVARHPGWDGEQIARELGEDVFEVLDVVRDLVEQGVVGSNR
jgi:hypothetical protein